MVEWHPAERSCWSGSGASLGIIYPRSIPRARRQHLAMLRQLQKSLNEAVTRWRPLICSSKVFLSCENILKQTWWGLCKAFQIESRELQQGTTLQALLEPQLYCARWIHFLGDPTWQLSCHGLIGQVCSPKWSTIHLAKHTPLFFSYWKRRLAKPYTSSVSFTGAAITF